ncbi:MAG: hypothetical protein ACK4NV_05485 [Pannonibacter sp.]|jgi:hypothetical protein
MTTGLATIGNSLAASGMRAKRFVVRRLRNPAAQGPACGRFSR